MLKKSILEIYHFFILILLSLLLIYLSISTIDSFKDKVQEKINQHLEEMKEEKKFVLILNYKTFTKANRFCLNELTKEDLKEFFDNNFYGNFLIQIFCKNEERNFYYSNLVDEKNTNCRYIYTSLYKIKVCS